MPEISRFYGIVIRMFIESSAQHHLPHFHAFYQEHAAVFTIDPVDMVAGVLPRAQQRLVEAWTEVHRDELLANWAALQARRAATPIAPLR